MTMGELSVLRESPSGDVVDSVLKELLLKSSDDLTVLNFDNSMMIIKYVIPIYPSLPTTTLHTLYELFSKNYIFLIQLLNFVKTFDQNISKEFRLYKNFIVTWLTKEKSTLYKYIMILPYNGCTSSKKRSNGSSLEVKKIKSIFFGSKLFNMLCDEEFNIIDYIFILERQWAFLIDTISHAEIFERWVVISEMVISFLSFHPIYSSDILFDKLFFFDIHYFKSLKLVIQNASTLERTKILDNFVLPFLEIKINPNSYSAIKCIIDELYLDFNFTILLKMKSIEFQEIIIRSFDSDKCHNFLNILLNKSKELVNSTNEDETVIEERDERLSQLIVICLKYGYSDVNKMELSQSSLFLNFVTTRLGHRSNLFRERTMFIAKIISDNKVNYESDYKIEIPELPLINENMNSLTLSKLRQNSKIDRNEKNFTTIKSDLSNNMALFLDDDGGIDSDDEESYISQKNIVFLKDLLEEYINFSKNNRNEIVPLLKTTIKLVRQKQYHPLEVEYYSKELMSHVSTINNNFDEKDFEQWRINALVSLIVVVPENITDIYHILFNSELSLQQRMSLLTSIGLASRELRGLDDKMIVKPRYDFASKRLPWDNTISTSGTGNQRITEVNGTSVSSNGQFLTESVTKWRSKKLDLAQKDNDTTRNRFRKVAPVFFYPLAHGWLNGIDLGSFDQIFKMHYISTLRIVYSCCHPVHQYEEMKLLMQQIMGQAMEQGIPIDK